MAVFFVYCPDGGDCTTEDREYAPSAEVVRRELAARVRTGKGSICLASEITEASWKGARRARREEEWPRATERAYMAVWRCRAGREPDGAPDELWHYSGNTDRPVITRVG